MSAQIAVEPKSGRYRALEAAVVGAGGVVVPAHEADALVWADPQKPDDLPIVLAAMPEARWVALPYAGIEPYVPYLDAQRVWTCARGVYARPVAEHALTLGLAGLRGVVSYSKAHSWGAQAGRNLIDGSVTIFGAGGITEHLIELLAPMRCRITVVRRRAEPVQGAHRVVSTDERLEALTGADLVVLALALTPETERLIAQPELAAMESHAWLVNVARGRHIDTDALVWALKGGLIGGAALDVTDPEPLADGHPLWAMDNVVITPHVGNTPEMGEPLLAAHIAENVRRFSEGLPLVGAVDVSAGY